MVSKLGPDEFDLTIKFGGGLHTRAAEDDIGDREATDGKNFTLDLERRELKPRKPFDLVATAANGLSINGGGSFLTAAGTVKAFIQAGTNVYEFTGSALTGSLATVSTSAKLRAHFRDHAWPLTDRVIITDLALVEVVKQWTGAAWSNIAFRSSPSTAFGVFYAKYCHVVDERVFYAHTKDAGGTFAHMIVGSQRSDLEEISVSNRPASSLAESDPFFLLSPDLKAINGFLEAFGSAVLSTEKGQIYNLTGASAKDFAFADFYPGSAAAGDESLTYIGNDIVYGRPGRLESLKDTDRFGDTETDDISRGIADQISAYTGWTIVYNSRLNRVYAFPTGVSECWVFDTAIRDEGQVSPWMRWETTHALAFRPTFVAPMLNPTDGLEYIFMGDSTGHLYKLEGTGASGDSGTNAIETEFLTKLFSIPLDAQAFDITGYIKYRKAVAATVEIIFEYAGEAIFNRSFTIDLPAAEGAIYYSQSGIYYSNGEYYGTISGRFARQKFAAPGQGNEFQVRVRIQSNNDFAISEIGLRFKAAG